jgi:ABC-type enterobactin transport system permease subunit
MGWARAAASAAAVLLLALSPGGSTDTFHLLFGSVLTVDTFHVVVLSLIAVATLLCQVLFGRRFLLVTFDAEAASVAGVNARGWSLMLYLMTGVAVATAVDHIGVLSTFALLTLPSTAALLQTRSMRADVRDRGRLGSRHIVAGARRVVQPRPAGRADHRRPPLACRSRGGDAEVVIEIRALRQGDDRTAFRVG